MRGNNGFVMKSELALTKESELALTQKREIMVEKIREITPSSFPNLCVSCFESDFKAMRGWKSPCCVGGKLLLSLLVTLQYTAHLLEQHKNANQSEHLGS